MGLFDIFKKNEPVQPQRSQQPSAAPVGVRDAYKKGDVIGNKYEVIDILGKGGCGIVYHVYSRETGNVCALKTFLDKYLSEVTIRERFKKEASVWVSLDKHPYIVTARFVDEISGRLFIGMDYVEPPDGGWNTLEQYLKYQQVDFTQGLRWAIQFCYGIEQAYNKGIKAHRDIKPANIMIASDCSVKITDFGLAGFIDARNDVIMAVKGSGHSSQTMMNVGMGTPTHMPPEQFINAAGCDERSDIYSFGVVLYQIASGGKLPFYTDNPTQFWQIMQHLHNEKTVPRLESKLDEIIQRCMAKKPSERYQSFIEIRNQLSSILERITGETIECPDESKVHVLDLVNKGISFKNIGMYNEAIDCYNKAISINPNIDILWNNYGITLHSIGDYEKAIKALEVAIHINSNYASAWLNKGLCYDSIGDSNSAFNCYSKAIELDDKLYFAYYNIGNQFFRNDKFIEALEYYNRSIDIFPHYSAAWSNKGKSLLQLGKYNEALENIDQSLKINPMSYYAWYNKGLCQQLMRKYSESIECFDKAISLKKDSTVWNSKGDSYRKMAKLDKAMECYQNALEIQANCVESLRSKVLCFWEMGQLNDALMFSKMALMIVPNDSYLTFLKASLEDNLGMKREALNSYGSFINIADDSLNDQVRLANGRIAYLSEEVSTL